MTVGFGQAGRRAGRRRRESIFVALALLTTAACGGDVAPPGQSVDALPLEEQVLTVGTLGDSYLSCKCDGPSFGKYPLNTSVFDTLVRMDENHQVVPMLAERWEFDEPANTYRFFLRRGVTFHDGQELTAEDVEYTFELFAEMSGTNYFQMGVDSVTVVDRYTVEITPVTKNNRMVEQLVHPDFGINRKGSYSDPFRPVGTGPYRFMEYVKNDRLVVERFEAHWDPERNARATRMTFRFIPDAQTRILALRSGELDLIIDVPRDAADGLEGAPDIEVVRSRVGAYNALSFNIAGIAPYDLPQDPAVRLAVALATDRSAVLERVWAGNAEESTTWVPPSVLGSQAATVEGVSHDPGRAREVLEQAGWTPGPDGIRLRDGRRLSLAHVVSGPGDSDPRDSVAAAELIQSQLKDVGVETTIEVPEAGLASARSTSGEYDLLQSVGNQNEANPCFLPDLSYYSKGTSPSVKFRAPGGKTDEAIEGCRTATDIEEVRRYSAEAIHQLVDVEHVVVPLIGLYRIWGMADNVAGFVPHPSLTNQRWEGVHLTG